MMKRAATANCETKWVTHTLPASVTTTVDTTVIHDISEGTGRKGERIGDWVYARSLRVSGEVVRNSSATGTLFTTVRVVVYTPRKGPSDLLSTIAVNTVLNSESHIIWLDRRYYVTPTDPIKRVSLFKKWYNKRIPGMKIMYKGDLDTDITKNGVWMAVVSDEDTHPPDIYMYTRLYYKDP